MQSKVTVFSCSFDVLRNIVNCNVMLMLAKQATGATQRDSWIILIITWTAIHSENYIIYYYYMMHKLTTACMAHIYANWRKKRLMAGAPFLVPASEIYLSLSASLISHSHTGARCIAAYGWLCYARAHTKLFKPYYRFNLAGWSLTNISLQIHLA